MRDRHITYTHSLLHTHTLAIFAQSLEQAMGEMEGEAPITEASGLSSRGGGGGEYTAEKLAALRKGQNFQVSTKSAKATAEMKGARVTFLAPGKWCRVSLLVLGRVWGRLVGVCRQENGTAIPGRCAGSSGGPPLINRPVPMQMGASCRQAWRRWGTRSWTRRRLRG